MRYMAVALVCACLPDHPHHAITSCSQPTEKQPGHEYYGRSWNVARLGELVIGDSTLEDAKCVLGQPMSKALVAGDLVVTWSYTDITPGQPDPKVDRVSIAFASDGVMKEIVGKPAAR